MPRRPPFCLTIQDFVNEAIRQGCREVTFGKSAALIRDGNIAFVVPSGPRSGWMDDAVALSGIRILNLRGFDTSEAALRSVVNWEPSEDEQS